MSLEEDAFEKDLVVFMNLEILLAEEQLVTRQINDDMTTLDDICRIRDELFKNKVNTNCTTVVCIVNLIL
jgi:hypothetical protein